MKKSVKVEKRSEYTGIKMERDLYEKARRRANERHQTYSEYIRQLIVSDLRLEGVRGK
jgi:hypothetical protein